MTPAEFECRGRALYGPRYRPPLARYLGVHVTTVWRYATGQVPIPRVVELALGKPPADRRDHRHWRIKL